MRLERALEDRAQHLVDRAQPGDQRIAKRGVYGQLPYAIRMCSRREIDEVRGFLAPRVEQLTGGPRNLAQALERAEQCVARVAAQRDSVIAYLDAR